MTTTDETYADLGPAITPPAWIEPGVVPPPWERVDEPRATNVAPPLQVGEKGPPAEVIGQDGKQTVGCFWECAISDDVSIECTDRVVDGRILRSQPRITYTGESEGVSIERARQLAKDLDTAADILATAQFVEQS